MLVDHLALDQARFADQQLAEMPGAVAGLDEPAVEPDDVGDGQSEQGCSAVAEHLHREQIVAVPIPAADTVEEADRRPGRPQPGDLDQAEVERFGKRPRRPVPVDARRGPAMDLVDEERPQDHRHSAGEKREQRAAMTGKAEGPGRGHPGEQPGEADEADARADRGTGPRIGLGFGGDLGLGVHGGGLKPEW
jgi:hypothetical protein